MQMVYGIPDGPYKGMYPIHTMHVVLHVLGGVVHIYHYLVQGVPQRVSYGVCLIQTPNRTLNLRCELGATLYRTL